MYDELIKRLRECTAEMNGEKTLWHQAANAIEELQKQLREEKVDNVNLTGWLAEEHAKLDIAEIENIKLKEEFAKYRKKYWWIPVTVRLPDENDVVLITDSLDVGTGYLIHGYGWISPFDDIETSHVSHWMPLPQPPESECGR